MNSQAYESFWPHSKRRPVSLQLPMTSLKRDGHFHAKSVSERETMGGAYSKEEESIKCILTNWEGLTSSNPTRGLSTETYHVRV